MPQVFKAVGVLASLAVTASLAGTAPPMEANTSGAFEVDNLRAAGMEQPLGIDDTSPGLSWQLESSQRGTTQSAYQIQVASTKEELLDGKADLWDTGRTESDHQRVHYGGTQLESRDRAWWRVRVWDGDRESSWSEPTWFEIGLVDDEDWQANWIANEQWLLSSKTPPSVTVDLPETTGRFVRLNVTELGLPLAEQPLGSRNGTVMTGEEPRFPDVTYRLQLAEMQVRHSDDPEVNFAEGREKNVTASEEDGKRKQWEPGLIADGQLTTNPQNSESSGYQSEGHRDSDVSDDPIWLEIDLGEEQTFDQVVLYPRTDTLTVDGEVPNFPVDFTIESASEPEQDFEMVAQVTDQETPEAWMPEALPLFADDFAVDDVASARLYVSGVGIYVPTINGERVGDAMLEPGNTDLEERIIYAAYDVTDLIEDGENALGIAVGNGAANSLHVNGRYRKFARTSSDLQVIAQLEVTHADGSRSIIGTDDSWRTTLGPTTSSNWFGGEDYDARREIPGWDTPVADRAEWESVTEVGAPAGSSELTARRSEPIRVIEELPGKEISRSASGARLYDLGKNVAAIPQLTVDAPSGTVIRAYPAESIRDDHVDQTWSNVGAPIWDQFISAGEKVTWNPEFNYHGFRYLEVVGLPESATLEVTGLHVHADNPSAGTLEISDEIMEGIHRITRQSLKNNMMSVLTDAPSREKLGWLEQTHLVFDTIARNYDVEAYLTKVLRDIVDAQEESGLVPSTVPDYVDLAGGYRNDPNWGGALIRVPLQHYRTYGNDDLIREYYPQMKHYLSFLEGSEERWTEAGLYDYGLGDWYTTADPAMPRPIVGTFGIWAIADGLADVADALGEDADAEEFRARADELSDAVWNEYYDAESETFEVDDMGAIAFALDMGAVPDDLESSMVERLIELIEAADWHLIIGEISFPSVLRVLSEAGHDDVVIKVSQQTTSPSLGYQVANGNTSLGENWDGGSGQSQSHFMLGAMDAWLLTRIPGIEQTEESVGFEELLINPAIGGDLTHASGSYETPFGLVESSWEVGDDQLTMDISIPAGSTAEVHVPLYRDEDGTFQMPIVKGAQPSEVGEDSAIFHVGSGEWQFVSPFTQSETTTTLAASPSPSTVGEGVSFEATVSMDDTPVASGEVQFLIDGEAVHTAVPDSDGIATTEEFDSLPEGEHVIVAQFSGDGYSDSDASISHEVLAVDETDPDDGSGDTGSDGVDEDGADSDGPGSDTDSAPDGEETDGSLPSTGAAITAYITAGVLMSILIALGYALRKRASIE